MRTATATATDPARDAVRRRLLDAPFDPATVEPEDLRAHLAGLLREEAPLCPPGAAEHLLDALVDDVGGLGPLERWLADPEVSEIMVNGPDRAYIERAGRLERIDVTLDAPAIVRLAERVVAPLGLRIDRASPMVDARLRDGSRVHAVLPPLAPDGPCLTIRRFVVRRVAVDEFGTGVPGAKFLTALVHAGWNVLVAGGTSAGKTTLCNALAAAVGHDERVVTIEETAELHLRHHHVVRLEARPANAEGVGAVSVRDLVRAALRMRPDRLIVGEVRGGEALDMLQALNTGHDGSLSTIHANTARDALTRLETLALFGGVALPVAAIRGQIGAGVDAVVHVTRADDGRRVVQEVAEVAENADSVRVLATRREDRLVAVEPPARRARRAATDVEGAWRECCP